MEPIVWWMVWQSSTFIFYCGYVVYLTIITNNMFCMINTFINCNTLELVKHQLPVGMNGCMDEEYGWQRYWLSFLAICYYIIGNRGFNFFQNIIKYSLLKLPESAWNVCHWTLQHLIHIKNCFFVAGFVVVCKAK